MVQRLPRVGGNVKSFMRFNVTFSPKGYRYRLGLGPFGYIISPMGHVEHFLSISLSKNSFKVLIVNDFLLN